MPVWLNYSLIAVLCWGVWAFLPKLATRTMDTPTTLLCYLGGSLVPVLFLLAMNKFQLKAEPSGVLCSALTGVFAIAGLAAYTQALARHQAAPVIMVTALYPLVTLLLSIAVLKEKLSVQQWLGVALAIAAIVLISVPFSNAGGLK